MAKILYLHEVREDYSSIIFFKNKKNLEAAKEELDKPDSYQDQEDYDYNKENNIEFIREGDFSYSKGLAFFAGDVGDGKNYDPYDGLEFRDMTEEQFRAQAEKHIEVFDAGDEQGPGGLLYYKGGIKEGTEIYMDSRSGIITDKGTSPKIAIEDGLYSIGESVKTTFKYVPTFESFTAPQKINENLSDEDRKAMMDVELKEIFRRATELAKRIKDMEEYAEPIDPAFVDQMVAQVKDAFKKEKIKLK
jgi:hypothetical protein